MKTFQTCSSIETRELGEQLGQAIVLRAKQKNGLNRKTAEVVLLYGELGAGKTTLTKGLYKGLGSRALATSPTFIIMRRSRIAGAMRKTTPFREVYHIDCYRLRDESALDVLEFDKLIGNPRNVIVIEWPEKIEKIIPRNRIKIQMSHGKKSEERNIKIVGIAFPG
ncbi:MAG: tRNA (adenosine(37)-N6)-threonylcarbamoyltransferase complex ATPase subunit type 1 TsaE [Candidatus Liptonbacteria bacterium]